MLRRTSISMAVAAAFGLGAVTVAMPAAAQQQGGSQQQLERIEITGSSIKRIEGETALPVQVITRSEIERTGAKSTAELIQNLPALQGFTTESISVGGGGAGFSGASIHNLGETRTLVLLNGRRIASFAGQTLTGALAGFDLNTIPLAAIERVEILADGASSLYGSDAVGGVVNFILKRNFSGGDVSAGLTSPQASGGAKEKRASALVGFGDLSKDRFNAMIGVSYDDRTPLKATDRNFSKTGTVDFTYNGTPYRFINDSFRGIPGNATPDNAPWVRNVYYQQNGRCPAQHFATDDGAGGFYCRYDYTADLEIFPESRRESAIGSVSFAVSPEMTLFGDLVFARSKTVSRIAPPPVDLSIPVGSTFWNQYAAILGASPADGDWFVGWRGQDFGKRTTDDQSQAIHLVAGAKGSMAGWDYEASATRSQNNWDEYYRDGWIARNGLLSALNSGTLNPFVEKGQQSAAAQTAIANSKATGLFQSGKSTLEMLQVRGSRELTTLPSGPLSLGTGADWRREGNKYSPGKFALGIDDGIAGDDSQAVPFDLTRTVYGAFGELSAPVAKGLEVTGSARFDKYSDFGNATTYKGQVRYQPTRTVLLRGSLGTGFRAPSVPQISGPAQQLYGVTGNNYSCPFVAPDPLAAVCPPRRIQYNVYAGANPDLKPEKSNQWTLGMRIEPTNTVSVGFDLWDVKVRDRISQKNEETVFGNPTLYRSNFTTYNDPVSGRTLLALFVPNENLGKEAYRGIDADARVAFGTPVGRLTSSAFGTYMMKYKYERFPGSGYFSNLGAYQDGGVTFRFQGRWTNTLEQGPFAHTLALNYKSKYKDQTQTVTNLNTQADEDITREVDAYYTFDWQTRFAITKQIKVTGGILNLLDKDPPLSIKSSGGQQIGYDNRYTDPRGRTFYVDLAYSF